MVFTTYKEINCVKEMRRKTIQNVCNMLLEQYLIYLWHKVGFTTFFCAKSNITH